jgi:two-component system chemotaxis sensor kinase CheA
MDEKESVLELYPLFVTDAQETLEKIQERFAHRVIKGEGDVGMEEFTDLLRPLHTLKGNAGMIGLEGFSKTIHSLEGLIKKKVVLSPDQFQTVLTVVEELKKSLPTIEKGEEPPHLKNLPRVVEEIEKGEAWKTHIPAQEERGEIVIGEEIQTIRVPAERLDILQRDLEGLHLARQELMDFWEREILPEAPIEKVQTFEEIRTKVGVYLRHLWEDTLSLRLLPLRFVLRRVPPMVADALRRSGKSADVVLEGEEVEVDKGVLEMVAEVLVHLIRNAVDHGIEPPEERKEKGKPPKGTIVVRAESKGDRLILVVEDDGRGIDIEKVRKKAVELNLVPEEKARNADGKEVLRYLFLSGFSTAEKTTELSGRGVGLDAVEYLVRSLGGSVEVESTFGSFTRFTLRIPITTQVTDLLVGEIDTYPLAFPLSRIGEMIRYQDEKVVKTDTLYHLLYRGEWIPLYNFSRYLPIQEKTPRYLLIFRTEKPYSVGVDRIVGKFQLVLKPLKDPLLRKGFFSSATILPDGRVGFVVDPDQIPSLYEEGKGSE